MKRQHKEWKRIIARYMSDAKLYTKNSKTFNTHTHTRKQASLPKNGDGTEKKMFSKEEIEMVIKYLKVVQHPYSSGKCK